MGCRLSENLFGEFLSSVHVCLGEKIEINESLFEAKLSLTVVDLFSQFLTTQAMSGHVNINSKNQLAIRPGIVTSIPWKLN